VIGVLLVELAVTTGCTPGSAKPAGLPTMPPPAALSVRVEWPSGELYRGGMRWTLRGTCSAGHAFHSKVDNNSYVPGGEWAIDWPDLCARTSVEISIDVMVNWMHCAPATATQRVVPGDKVVLRLASSKSCDPRHGP
jgi:hypothetical protein